MSFTQLVAIVFALALIVLAYRHNRRRQRRVDKRDTYWSIGYQRSSHPLEWDPETAKVYSKHQAADGISTLADPFIISRGNEIFLFCEVMVSSSAKGSIGVSVYDRQRDAWRFSSIVLEEPFHLSYPYVFSDGSDVYMVPEAKGSRSVRLYKATEFPYQWKLEKVLIENRKLVDPSVLLWKQTYYLFASRKSRLYLYYSDALTGEWKSHRESPLWKWSSSRCAGRIFEDNGSLYRFAQESGRRGARVCGYRITELSCDEYKEVALEENPLLEACGKSWTRNGMHHVDILKLRQDDYFAVFDGRGVVSS